MLKPSTSRPSLAISTTQPSSLRRKIRDWRSCAKRRRRNSVSRRLNLPRYEHLFETWHPWWKQVRCELFFVFLPRLTTSRKDYMKLRDSAAKAALLTQKIIDARLALTRLRHAHPKPRLTISAAEQRLADQVTEMQVLNDNIEEASKRTHNV